MICLGFFLSKAHLAWKTDSGRSEEICSGVGLSPRTADQCPDCGFSWVYPLQLDGSDESRLEANSYMYGLN